MGIEESSIFVLDIWICFPFQRCLTTERSFSKKRVSEIDAPYPRSESGFFGEKEAKKKTIGSVID